MQNYSDINYESFPVPISSSTYTGSNSPPPAKPPKGANSPLPYRKTTKSSSSPVTRFTRPPKLNFGPSSPEPSMTAYFVTPPLA